MVTQKERFQKYLQTCVKSTRATDSNPLLLGGNAPKDYARFLEPDRLFDYNPVKWKSTGSMYDITDYDKALEIFNELVSDDDFIKRDKNDNQGWRRGAVSHYVCFLSAEKFFKESEPEQNYKADTADAPASPLDLPLQLIFYGAPGTGKSHTVDDVCKKYTHFRTTFHPDSDYSTFVGCYKPTMGKAMPIYGFDSVGHTVKVQDPVGSVVTKKNITYSFTPQTFTNAYIKAWRDLSKPVFLVIEEINRGNCAQIFGDLFQLLDRKDNGYSSYEIEPNTDLGNYIKDKGLNIEGVKDSDGKDISDKLMSGELMTLPPNLHIWATMNTSDQSLFPIDSAFKRRWDWKYMPINPKAKSGWTIEVNGISYSWSSFLEKINTEIEDTTSSEDKQLGFFFCKADDTDANDNNGKISAEKFVGKVLFYIYNDVFKDYGFEREFFKGEDNKIITFRSFFEVNGDINEVRVAELLENLKVEHGEGTTDTGVDEDVEDGDEDVNESSSSSSGSSYDRSKYAINGVGNYGKANVACEALKIYVANNPTKTSKEIVDDWLALGVNVPNFVETSDTYKLRTKGSTDPNLERRCKVVTLLNGETIYVSNQYNPERISELIKKVNSTDWNITISQV